MSRKAIKRTKRPVARTRRTAPRKRIVIPTAVIVAAVALLLIAVGGTAYSINLENHDAFCASCHTQPETKFVQEESDTSSASLAAFHAGKEVRCIDCHSGAGALGRAVGLMQGGQDLIAYASGRYHNPAITTNPIQDPSCIKCHGETMTRQTFDNHFHVFLPRWQAMDSNAAHCVDCHASHGTATADQGYLIQAAVEPVCQRCHQTLGG